MLVWSFLWFSFIVSYLTMAARGKATKITAQKPILMLDSSAIGSDLEGYKSDGSLDGDWQGEEEEKKAGCAGRNKDGLVTSVDDDQTPNELTCVDNGASISREDFLDSGTSDADRESSSQASDPSNLTVAAGGASTTQYYTVSMVIK